MRSIRFAWLGAVLALLVALRVQAGTGAPPAAVSMPDLSAHTVEAGPTPVTVSAEADGDSAQSTESSAADVAIAPAAAPAPDGTERRRRYRDFNRYPGPIPTPEEWVPPDGPVRIALQAGHWRADEAPGELSGLKENGTRWGATAEWEVNLEIARTAGALLEELGYEVDILPAVVPPGYRAHLFISIHADGSANPNASGYRVAAPGRDATGRASQVVALLERSYGEATGLRRLPDVTRRMLNYYAFNFRRYEHALHPMTIGVILETGYLTSARDRDVILNDPSRAARGIVAAVTAFPITTLTTVLSGQ